MQIFWTVISGVCVFVVGQVVLKLFLDPIVAFKQVLGELSAVFLKEQQTILSCIGDDILENRIHALSATIMAHRQAIPFYNRISFLFALPADSEVIRGCWALNLIGTLSKEGSYDNEFLPFDPRISPPGSSPVPHPIQEINKTAVIVEEIRNASSYFKIRLDYGAVVPHESMCESNEPK